VGTSIIVTPQPEAAAVRVRSEGTPLPQSWVNSDVCKIYMAVV